MNWSKIAQLIIGVFLGLAFVVGGLTLGGYFYFSQFSGAPKKPTFPNDDKAAVTPKIASYSAEVSYQNGLFLRSAPSAEAKSLAVLKFRHPLQVLDVSADQKWQKVETTIEQDDLTQAVVGWVGIGNVEKVEPDSDDS
ncbi:MAG: SH3 domain-containing protein [Thermosynechococcaceae cyanobacterium]